MGLDIDKQKILAEVSGFDNEPKISIQDALLDNLVDTHIGGVLALDENCEGIDMIMHFVSEAVTAALSLVNLSRRSVPILNPKQVLKIQEVIGNMIYKFYDDKDLNYPSIECTNIIISLATYLNSLDLPEEKTLE